MYVDIQYIVHHKARPAFNAFHLKFQTFLNIKRKKNTNRMLGQNFVFG